ncbi:hypothetical protein GCM10027063_33870 [Promicromonospora xylanilytica]
MRLPHRLRPVLSGSRHRATAVAAAMLLVLAAAGGQAACGVQAAEPTGAVVQGTTTVGRAESVTVSPAESMADGPSGCADHDTATAQSDPVPPSPVPAAMPEHAAARMALIGARQVHRTASSVAVADAPSLHALGISRT